MHEIVFEFFFYSFNFQHAFLEVESRKAKGSLRFFDAISVFSSRSHTLEELLEALLRGCMRTQ